MSTRKVAQTKIHPVTIGERRIGPGRDVFVVAEAGVNHNGCVEQALALVDAGAEAGADAVKFQMFRAADLVTSSAPTVKYQKDRCGQDSQQVMLTELELSQDDFVSICRHCDERSIMFLATPFSEVDVARLQLLEPQAVKIASTDLTNHILLGVAADTGQPLILSTGTSTSEEIQAALVYLRERTAGGRIILLHCVSCYPTPVDAMNLRVIESMQSTFCVPCGLSDHSLSLDMGGWAVAAGASVVEKHFTLDRMSAGPDHAMSLDPKELREYVATIRVAEQAMGDGAIGVQDMEAEVCKVARKSVVSALDIAAGTLITKDMLTLKRPGTGIPANELERVVTHRAVVDIPSDAVLTWDMFA